MAWDWIEKGAKRLQEIGGEYKQHQALVERLLTLDSIAAQLEVSRLWPAMDDRARARGCKKASACPALSASARQGKRRGAGARDPPQGAPSRHRAGVARHAT